VERAEADLSVVLDRVTRGGHARVRRLRRIARALASRRREAALAASPAVGVLSRKNERLDVERGDLGAAPADVAGRRRHGEEREHAGDRRPPDPHASTSYVRISPSCPLSTGYVAVATSRVPVP